MEQIKMKLIGVTPLLMHNARLADPINEYTEAIKLITSKKTKTKDDRIEISRLEWEGGLYYSDELGPYVPDQNIEGFLADGARVHKQGQDASAGISVINHAPLECKWPKKKQLRDVFDSREFTDIRSVVVQKNRVMRCRPIFREWSLTFTAVFDPEIVNRSDILQFAVVAGKRKGLCDGTPKFGRCTVEEFTN